MLSLILVCVILCYIGFILNKEITLEEFCLNVIISVCVSVVVFIIMLLPVPNDTYYQSGRLSRIEYHPYFVEEYEQRHEEEYACGKDDDGYTKYCTRVWYTTEHATHHPYWTAEDTLKQDIYIDSAKYAQIKHDFGNKQRVYNNGRGTRCTHGGKAIRGDNSLYYVLNDTNTYLYPTTSIGYWYNPLRKSQSILNTEKDVLKYPDRVDLFRNTRYDGKNSLAWNMMNTRLYERMGLNVVLTTSKEDLKNTWMRGKKNDVIIQVDNIKNPKTVKVFGWYKSERLSTELETTILDNGIDLDKIEHVILSYYIPFDFKEFDYLKFKLADWQLIIIAILTIITMVGTYVTFSQNEFRR